MDTTSTVLPLFVLPLPLIFLSLCIFLLFDEGAPNTNKHLYHPAPNTNTLIILLQTQLNTSIILVQTQTNTSLHHLNTVNVNDGLDTSSAGGYKSIWGMYSRVILQKCTIEYLRVGGRALLRSGIHQARRFVKTKHTTRKADRWLLLQRLIREALPITECI